MVQQEDENLGRAFAKAFVGSLSRAQRSRLKDVVCNSKRIPTQDLKDLPMLKTLVGSGSNGSYEMREDALRLLQLVFGCKATPARGFHPFIAITGGMEIAANVGIGQVEAGSLREGLFEIVRAMKAGNLAQADALLTVLSERFSVPTLEDCSPSDPPELSCVLFMKAIYDDANISDKAVERLFEILASLPSDSALLRAILYNVAVDVFLRRHKMSEAEQAAHRAVFHYSAAGEDGVAFYVHLYLAVIGLWRGEIDATTARLVEARAALSAFDGAIANDELLLRSFELITLYEQGHGDPLIKHLMSDDETIPFGELWPTIADPIISFGRRALTSRVTPAAALSWVRRWRVKQRRSLRFDRLITVQEAFALQDLGRWQEADELLLGVEDAGDLDPLIARFASGLDRSPKSNTLGQQIAACLKREDLSVRQRLTLRILATQSALARGFEREGARHLSAAIKDVDPDSHSLIWTEHRARIAHLFSKRDLRAELRRFPRLQRQIKTLTKVETTQKPNALTRQEFRVLQLLAEAQSNKAIGLRLGISLPTVKFHVANLCRKVDVTNRRDAVREAIRRGWLHRNETHTFMP